MTCQLLAVLVVALANDAPAETVRVLVASQEIPEGVTIDKPEKFFRFVRYFKGEEPRGGISDLEKLKGKVVKRTLNEDQPVKESDLRLPENPLNLPKGMRAVAIKIEPDNLAAGFIMPGSRVDVISVMKQPGGKEGKAKMLVEDLLVLAVDSQIDDKVQAMTVTLAATPEQVGKLAQAAAKGKLRVALRAPREEK